MYNTLRVQIVGYCASILLFFFLGQITVYTQTAAPSDISSSLNSFVQPTGIEQQTLTQAAGGGIALAYQVVGLIFFILAIYAGVLWMTAQGKEDTIAKARNILVGATLGMVVVISAYGITEFITNRGTDTFSSSGSGQATPSGALNSDTGEVVTPQFGCCVYLNSSRRREFVSGMYSNIADCQRDVDASPGDDDYGDGSSDEHDWYFYASVHSPESCVGLDRCWDMGNTENRVSCISSVTTP